MLAEDLRFDHIENYFDDFLSEDKAYVEYYIYPANKMIYAILKVWLKYDIGEIKAHWENEDTYEADASKAVSVDHYALYWENEDDAEDEEMSFDKAVELFGCSTEDLNKVIDAACKDACEWFVEYLNDYYEDHFDDLFEGLEDSLIQFVDDNDEVVEVGEYDNFEESLDEGASFFDDETDKEDGSWGDKAWMLNQIISHLNDEEAYYSDWLYIWPDGESYGECLDDFADAENYYELERSFKAHYSDDEAHEGGLYRSPYDRLNDTEWNKIIEAAHEWDKELGLPEIAVIDGTKDSLD